MRSKNHVPQSLRTRFTDQLAKLAHSVVANSHGVLSATGTVEQWSRDLSQSSQTGAEDEAVAALQARREKRARALRAELDGALMRRDVKQVMQSLGEGEALRLTRPDVDPDTTLQTSIALTREGFVSAPIESPATFDAVTAELLSRSRESARGLFLSAETLREAIDGLVSDFARRDAHPDALRLRAVS